MAFPSENLTSLFSPLPYKATYLPWVNNTHFTGLSFFLACLIPCFEPDSPLRRGILLLQIICIAQAFITPPPSDVHNTAVLYTGGVLMGNLLARYVDRLYLRTPEVAFHRLKTHHGKDDRSRGHGSNDSASSSTGVTRPPIEDARKLPPSKRFLWMFELLAVTRGIGWDWQVPGIPKCKPELSRAQFLFASLWRYIAMYAGLYLVSLISEEILDGFSRIHHASLRNVLLALSTNPVPMAIFIVLGWAMTIYSHFGLLTLPISMICVGLGVGPPAWREPGAWLPNFGSLDEAYSIRRFWGYTWHQQLRRMASAPGAYLLSLLPVKVQRSNELPIRLARRYGLVIASFLVSGLIHAAGSYNVTRATGLPISDGGEIRYFVMQGVAIIADDGVLWALGVDYRKGKREDGRWMRKLLGYLVTATWYIYTRVWFKAVPLAIAHGIRDDNGRGDLFAAVELVRRGALAVPGNFVTAAVRHWINVS
ncbi:hypothetical protein DV737_g4174, partial [Chaetothyriales sp. CBS 132003]